MKLISGGQTGADRAALDVALALGLPHGGSVPKGRMAEDGPIPLVYDVVELNSADPSDRTKRNILDADGTLLVTHGEPSGGSALTRDFAELNQKSLLHVDLNKCDDERAVHLIAEWLQSIECRTLNVAGPRHSEDPTIYRATYQILSRVLSCS